jgi:hypothetical protein
MPLRRFPKGRSSNSLLDKDENRPGLVAMFLTLIQEVVSQNIDNRCFPQPLQAYAGILPRLSHHLFKILSKLPLVIVHSLDAVV